MKTARASVERIRGRMGETKAKARRAAFLIFMKNGVVEIASERGYMPNEADRVRGKYAPAEVKKWLGSYGNRLSAEELRRLLTWHHRWSTEVQAATRQLPSAGPTERPPSLPSVAMPLGEARGDQTVGAEPPNVCRHRDALIAAAKRLGNRLSIPDWEHPAKALVGALTATSDSEKEHSWSHWSYVVRQPSSWDSEPIYESLRAHTANHPCWTAYGSFLALYRQYLDHLGSLIRRLVAECKELEERFLHGPSKNPRFCLYGTGRWDVVQLLSFVLFQACGKVPGVAWSHPGHWYWVQGYRESEESLSWGGTYIAWGDAAWLAEARAAHEDLVKRLMKDADILKLVDLFDQVSDAKNKARRALEGIAYADLGREQLPCCPSE